jgi:uncharacterized protein (TIGR03437 family)
MRSVLRAALGVLWTWACFAQPVVNAAMNAASYFSPPKGDTPIAQGSIFTVFGTGLAGPDLQQASLPLGTSLPSANGTSIVISSGGQNIDAYILYTLPTQVAAVLPSTAPVGSASLTLTYAGNTSSSLPIRITRTVPGIFTANSQGSGPAAALVALSSTGARRNSLTNPAAPGSVVSLFGTGLGPIAGADNVAPGAVTPEVTATATVGGKIATVLYAGRAPQFPGEDQINIQLPSDIPLGCYTPAVITVNGIPSNDFVLSTGQAGRGSCVHPMGLLPEAEAAIDADGTLNIGAFSGVLGTIGTLSQEGVAGFFANVGRDGLYATYAQLLSNFHASPYPVPTGECVVYDQLSASQPASVFLSIITVAGGHELKAANSLTLSGLIPSGLTKNSQTVTQPVARSAAGDGYLWTNTIFGPATAAHLTQGSWSLISDSSGADVNPFSASAQLPMTLTWGNITGLNSPSRTGVTITWTGACATGGPTAQNGCLPNPVDYVNIFGNSSVFNATDPSRNRGKSFACNVPSQQGIFVIPSDVTGVLPVAGVDEQSRGALGIVYSNSAPFLAFLANGQRLDGGLFAFSEYMMNSGPAFAWK